MLDKRLRLCADMVRGKRVCDVGTDHAYLAAELLSEGRCDTAVAADINEKPLAAARLTLEKAGVLDRAELILSDGLENIPESGITDIVIAGMGGELIADILSRCDWLDGKNLILQPMSRADFLIRRLCENGFEILKQCAAVDGKFRYTVINAVKNRAAPYTPPPIFQLLGKLDLSDPAARLYAEGQAERLLREGRASRRTEKTALAAEIFTRIGRDTMYCVKDLMILMDKIAPMKNLHKGDNSGLLVGDKSASVTKVLFALDITCEVVREAAKIGAEAIIAHHPVIFHPLYSLDDSNPACLALKHGIACICFHSPLDMADGGINDIIFDMLNSALGLKKQSVLEPVHPDGRGYGWVCTSGSELYPDEFGKMLKDVFGCTIVRYTDSGSIIKKIAFCSGGAGSDLPAAIAAGADAYITGDVKHDQWITARNAGIALYDCGHFHTEDIAVPYLIKRFKEEYPQLEAVRARADRDPVDYIL
ncbi:MAG: Nif3-like dinuclear metal center hexameric protein [Ruminococcus sp.]|nr:Nif3-like dinuclear metal center hexameric protein [Ruminococcus sp.]